MYVSSFFFFSFLKRHIWTSQCNLFYIPFHCNISFFFFLNHRSSVNKSSNEQSMHKVMTLLTLNKQNKQKINKQTRNHIHVQVVMSTFVVISE